MEFLLLIKEYILVFLISALPWVEALFVIPVAIAAGASPAWVVLSAFAGTTTMLWAIVFLFERLERWWMKRRARKQEANGREEKKKLTKSPIRRARAQKIWERYGLAGVALVAPVLLGVCLAAFILLALKSPKLPTALWLTVSTAIWSAAIGVLSHQGLTLFGWF